MSQNNPNQADETFEGSGFDDVITDLGEEAEISVFSEDSSNNDVWFGVFCLSDKNKKLSKNFMKNFSYFMRRNTFPRNNL